VQAQTGRLGARHAARLRLLMRREGVRPTAISHSIMLQSLWHQSEHAVEILDEAMVQHAAFQRCLRTDPRSGGWTLDLHTFSPGAAVALMLWVLSLAIKLHVRGQPLPTACTLITGWGKHSTAPRGGRERSAVRGAVLEALRICRVPLVAEQSACHGGLREPNPGLVEVNMLEFSRWVESAIGSGLIRGYFEDGDRLLIDVSSWAKPILEASSASNGRT